ncbi:type II secretion system protein [Acetobacterium sp.]|jgi:type IV pilus assembly protein PilA|uniref:type II secretion system protein n=1 Tax=Acetobacterium sp. TaxID=1872094 RepID=UPI000CBDDFA2|nr:type II secretion system protein [Acetobacterium sp.]MDO9492795.1 type II secretion system protein [Acetobacterium sp.]PKM70884.1 MAG: hypothetical protein CVU92_11280 [Firmicutes bacterium HGW-Firmicutes-17]
MELINRMRKNRKGFTLVEIIVVLVILAILAAFTIPTMMGFVGDAKAKSYIAEAREVYVAAQTTATEYAAKGATTAELTAALQSAQVKVNRTAKTNPSISDQASFQMFTYLDGDINPIADKTSALATNAEGQKYGYAWWTVTMGTDAPNTYASVNSNKAKVTGLTYVKNGYQVIIENGNATATKL